MSLRMRSPKASIDDRFSERGIVRRRAGPPTRDHGDDGTALDFERLTRRGRRNPHAAEPDSRPDVVLPNRLMGQLDGKVAIVTGAARGIGRAIADGLAAEGARIVVADLGGAEDAAGAYPDGVGLTVDVADEAAVERMVAETVERCGGLDVLVNNAGLYASLAMRPFTEIPLDEWRRVMDVNVASMFLTCRAAVPAMRERGGGAVVNISSGTPFRGVPFLLHYVTSKGAIVAFTRALAKELGADGIRVNCVAPGFTISDGVKEHPEVIEKLRDVSVAARTLQRDQVPEDVVGAVVYLSGPSAAFVTGQTIVIDGGQYFH
jgi:NAD(P)-dependent dehydrogenase (short-subunit alcohol dehydrogenase family)